MANYLVFTLSANIGSMGEHAGHERRPTKGWPGRSAVLGLVAAALGLRREDIRGLAELDALSIATAIFKEGDPLRDYHTVQTIPTSVVKKPDSRPSALRKAGGRADTRISIRDYRQGLLYGIALWNLPLDRLELLLKALLQPTFTLYFGRKSCPLSAPLVPKLVQASAFTDALNELVLPPWLDHEVASHIVLDSELTENTEGRIEWHHDRPIDRQAWHFSSNKVVVVQSEVRPNAGSE